MEPRANRDVPASTEERYTHDARHSPLLRPGSDQLTARLP
jgi:hypothetical protein